MSTNIILNTWSPTYPNCYRR